MSAARRAALHPRCRGLRSCCGESFGRLLPRRRPADATTHGFLPSLALGLPLPSEAHRLRRLAPCLVRQPPAGLRVSIQIDAGGNLASARVIRSSGDPGLDELTLRIIRTAAPFEPFSPEMRRTTKIVELNSDFYFH